MATRTIISTATLHVAGPNFKPYKFNAESGVNEGVYHVIEVKPGDPITLDAREADDLIARGLADLPPDPSDLLPPPVPVVVPAGSAPEAPAKPDKPK